VFCVSARTEGIKPFEQIINPVVLRQFLVSEAPKRKARNVSGHFKKYSSNEIHSDNIDI
jgi:hypothetical protein